MSDQNQIGEAKEPASVSTESPRPALAGFGYIGVKACGCAVRAIVDAPDYKDQIAERLPEWIKAGLTIERVTIEEGRSRLQRCPHGQQIPLGV